MNTQAEHGITAAAVPRSERATPASLHTDLSLAREEIKELKQERDALKRRIQLALGAQIDNAANAELVTRIQDLERHNATLSKDLIDSNRRAERLAGQLQAGEETIESLRLALRKTMRAIPGT